MVKNRKCIACGTKYSYCPDCSRADALKPAWYSDFCIESCKELWFTLTRYNMGRLTKSEAKSVILDLDLKPIESYSQFVQRDYAKVMAEEKKPLYNSVTLSHDTLKKYFPRSYTAKQMEKVIIKLLDNWLKKRQQEQQR